MKAKTLLHFCPEDGWVGDPMPMWHEGVCHLYYTKKRWDGQVVWGHVSTADYVHYTEYPDPLQCGGENDLDAQGICTGCVIYHDGLFRMFYAASDRFGKPHMLQAVSEDGISFEKEKRELFLQNTAFYRDDCTWRDPCVVFDDANRNWKMFFCTRCVSSGILPGQIGMAESKDLEHWILLPPGTLREACGSLECPDVFRMENQWAMLYYWHDTRVRFSDSLNGNWERRKVLSPAHFDFMAAKCADDGTRKILVGWVPRKPCDCGERIWGGNLAWLRELTLDQEGNPACHFLPELANIFNRQVSFAPEVLHGQCKTKPGGWEINRGSVLLRKVPENYRLRFHVRTDNPLSVVTLFLRLNWESEQAKENWNGEFSAGYQLILDYPSQLLRVREHYQWDQRPDLAAIPLNRAGEDSISLDVLLNEDILEVCVNERETMTIRLMKSRKGKLGISVTDGCATLTDWSLCGKG